MNAAAAFVAVLYYLFLHLVHPAPIKRKSDFDQQEVYVQLNNINPAILQILLNQQINDGNMTPDSSVNSLHLPGVFVNALAAFVGHKNVNQYQTNDIGDSESSNYPSVESISSYTSSYDSDRDIKSSSNSGESENSSSSDRNISFSNRQITMNKIGHFKKKNSAMSSGFSSFTNKVSKGKSIIRLKSKQKTTDEGRGPTSLPFRSASPSSINSDTSKSSLISSSEIWHILSTTLSPITSSRFIKAITSRSILINATPYLNNMHTTINVFPTSVFPQSDNALTQSPTDAIVTDTTVFDKGMTTVMAQTTTAWSEPSLRAENSGTSPQSSTMSLSDEDTKTFYKSTTHNPLQTTHIPVQTSYFYNPKTKQLLKESTVKDFPTTHTFIKSTLLSPKESATHPGFMTKSSTVSRFSISSGHTEQLHDSKNGYPAKKWRGQHQHKGNIVRSDIFYLTSDSTVFSSIYKKSVHHEKLLSVGSSLSTLPLSTPASYSSNSP